MRLSVDSKDVFVATGGREFDPALPAVVFLHGAGMDHSVWALLARAFASHGFGVLAPDFPGHGRSAGAPLSSIAALADWTAALIEAAGVRAARLVGHSMGSLVAIETAARHRERSHRTRLDRHCCGNAGIGRSSECGQGQRPCGRRHDLALGLRLSRHARRFTSSGPVDAGRRRTPAGTRASRRHLRRSLRVQRLSRRACRGGKGRPCRRS